MFKIFCMYSDSWLNIALSWTLERRSNIFTVEAATGGVLSKKKFLKILNENFTGKPLCWSLLLIKLQASGLWNISKFLRTPDLKNIRERLLLLLVCNSPYIKDSFCCAQEQYLLFSGSWEIIPHLLNYLQK